MQDIVYRHYCILLAVVQLLTVSSTSHEALLIWFVSMCPHWHKSILILIKQGKESGLICHYWTVYEKASVRQKAEICCHLFLLPIDKLFLSPEDYFPLVRSISDCFFSLFFPLCCGFFCSHVHSCSRAVPVPAHWQLNVLSRWLELHESTTACFASMPSELTGPLALLLT